MVTEYYGTVDDKTPAPPTSAQLLLGCTSSKMRLLAVFFLAALPSPQVEGTLAEIRDFIGGIFRREPQQSFTTTESSANNSETSPAGSDQFQTHEWGGITYLLSWREGKDSFTWDEAKSYCIIKGMIMVSLDNKDKRDHFLQLVEGDGVRAFWAGGEISKDETLLSWENGKIEDIVRGVEPWSFTGLRGPQPDGLGSESCLAVLNNFYNVSLKQQ